ncbi:MAG: hypothetical protein ACOH2K_09805 [Burkholderiaceae bacterium]
MSMTVSASAAEPMMGQGQAQAGSASDAMPEWRGMMGGWASAMGPMVMLDLSDAQTAQLVKTQIVTMQKQRTLMHQIWDLQGKLGDLLSAEKRDPAAIGKAYGKLTDLQCQAETRIDAENKMAAVLAKEQKMQMRRNFGRGIMGY